MENCIFCKIANKVIPSYTVYEDDVCLAFLDLGQLTKGHTLVVPKTHYSNLLEVEENTLKHLIVVAQKIAQAMMKLDGVEGINIINNCNEVAGQSVMHFHIHILPRYTKEEFGFKEISHDKISEEEFTEIAKQIKREL